MWWRLKRSDYEKMKGTKNKNAMKKLVNSGISPGLLFYSGKIPFAWCSLGPRDNYPVLERSRVLKRIDDKSVWSIVCFFMLKEYRNKGISKFIISSAIKYAGSKGASTLEAYPVAPKTDKMPAVFAWTGFEKAFKTCGFKEVERRSETRPIMRYYI